MRGECIVVTDKWMTKQQREKVKENLRHKHEAKFREVFAQQAQAVQEMLQFNIESIENERACAYAWQIVHTFRSVVEIGGYASEYENACQKDNGNGIQHGPRATKRDFESAKNQLESALDSMVTLRKDFGAYNLISSFMSDEAVVIHGALPTDSYDWALDAIADLKRALERVLDHGALFPRKEQFLRERVMREIIRIYSDCGRDAYADLKKDKQDYDGPFIWLTQNIFEALGVYSNADAPQPCGTTIKKTLDTIMNERD